MAKKIELRRLTSSFLKTEMRMDNAGQAAHADVLRAARHLIVSYFQNSTGGVRVCTSIDPNSH
jgi:hypothetical protein